MDKQMAYLEQTLSKLIGELKQKNCLSQEFEFSTKAEREQKIDDFVEHFINRSHDLG